MKDKTFTLIILSFMFRDGEWNLVFNYCSLCLVAVMLSLNFYYVDYCTVSALHTVVYYAISFVLMLLMFYEVGFYTVVLINIFLFASHYRLMNKKSVKWVNLIFTGIFSVLLITTFVMRVPTTIARTRVAPTFPSPTITIFISFTYISN